MSQSLDLRKSISIIRRLKTVVGVFSAAGLLAGVAYAALNPPQLSSTAVVSFPASVLSTSTEVVIADSYPVLAAASASLSPPVPVGKLQSEVEAKSLTSYLISITATGGTSAQAEAAANAVAESYITYVGDRKTPVEHVVAELFQPAITAGAPSRLESMLTAALIGAVAGALVGSVVALAIGRKDRRLRERDQIANSLGVPVLASVPVGHPSDPASWANLLESYKPKSVHAWQLRAVLRYLGIVNQTFVQSSGDEGVRAVPTGDGDVTSVGVISLSSDPGALALGPQLAVFAASQGIPTALVIGPQQDADATAALRTACDLPLSSPPLPGGLRIIVSGDQYVEVQKDVALIVAVAVLDGQAPKMPQTVRTAATVIGVSTGRVTAEQLARAAVAAGADGREVTGILVADPELTDKTTGRVPHLTRLPRRRLPSRLKGLVTEIKQ
jgi:capsular polysaccharide biosynthesis protein